jgi:O-antigen ligase
LGTTYFHLAQFSSLCAIVTLSLVETVNGTAKRWGIFALAGFVSWPLLFSGSRTGLALLVFSMGVGFLLLHGARSRFIGLLLAIGVVLVISPNTTNFEVLNESSATFSRLSTIEEDSANSIENRLDSTSGFNLDNYKWSSLMPLIGGGFYVAPSIRGATEMYRVGYGIHNTYLFVFEQAGIFAAVAFIYFLYAIIRKLYRVRNLGTAADRAYAIAALSYMLASLPVYLAGQIFWMGFETGHFNAFLLIVLLIALRPAVMTAGKSTITMRSPAYQPVERVVAGGVTISRPLRNTR